MLVSGRSRQLIEYALDRLLDLVPGSVVARYGAKDMSPKRLLTELGASPTFHSNQVVIYENCQEAGDLTPLVWYASNPTPRVVLILTADKVRGEDGERWIPSNPKVLYVDCGNLTEQGLVQIAETSGLSTVDAEWLVEACLSDVGEIFRVLDLLSVFKKVDRDILRQVAGRHSGSLSPLLQYGIVDTGNTSSILRQLRRRLTQMFKIASGLNSRAQILDIARQADVEPFIVKRLMPLVKGTAPRIWFDRLVSVVSLEERVRTDAPGVRECLELVLMG